MNKAILARFEAGRRVTALDLQVVARESRQYAKFLDDLLQPCERCGLAFNAVGGVKVCNDCKGEIWER